MHWVLHQNLVYFSGVHNINFYSGVWPCTFGLDLGIFDTSPLFSSSLSCMLKGFLKVCILYYFCHVACASLIFLWAFPSINW